MRLLSLLFLTTVPLALAFPVEEGWANSTAVEPVHGPHVKRDGPPKEGGDWREEYLLEEEIAIKVAGTNYALDNTDGTAKGGTQIWQYHGGENQRWLRFNWHDWEGRTTLHYRKFKLQRKNSNLCLHFKHDKILQDSLPMKDVPLVLADCQKATPFFWDKSNICAHVVTHYCIEFKGEKYHLGNGRKLVVNSIGEHRIPWMRTDLIEAGYSKIPDPEAEDEDEDKD